MTEPALSTSIAHKRNLDLSAMRSALAPFAKIADEQLNGDRRSGTITVTLDVADVWLAYDLSR